MRFGRRWVCGRALAVLFGTNDITDEERLAADGVR